MKHTIQLTSVIATLAIFAGSVFARPMATHADEPREQTSAPKKKGAGEACNSADECRRHYRCEKKGGEKKVCIAPEPHEIPKT